MGEIQIREREFNWKPRKGHRFCVLNGKVTCRVLMAWPWDIFWISWWLFIIRNASASNQTLQNVISGGQFNPVTNVNMISPAEEA